MEPDDRASVAHLIYASTNAWYQKNRNMPIFTGPPSDCEIFCRVYEDLDPGRCLLAVDVSTQTIVGSCFVHPRPTHVSVGIVNTHPDYFGSGIARRLLDRVIAEAEAINLPVRLVSSAMNLDSFSLYTRLGFVPRMAFQDMFLPAEKASEIPALPESERVRPATPNDAPAMASLERELVGIQRQKDYEYFLRNRDGIWSVSVLESERGDIEGFLISIAHPASTMLGPGVTRTDDGAAALIRAELLNRPGLSPVFLVPAERESLVRRLYSWGARNCEIHFSQIRGAWQQPTGVVMPTFMPETG
jgi:GNAT superfamily N-acetyltransferase